MLKVIATVSAIFEGLMQLGCTVLDEDISAIEKLVIMLEETSIVELSNNDGKIVMSFDIDVSANQEELADFVRVEEALGFSVFVSTAPIANNPALNNVILKKEFIMNANNKTNAASSVNQEALNEAVAQALAPAQAVLSEAIARANAATEEAVSISKSFMQTIELSKAMTAQSLQENEAFNLAASTALNLLNTEINQNAGKLEQATKAATAKSEQCASTCINMVDALNAQRAAAEQVDEDTPWYASTTAKRAGVVAAALSAAAVVHFGWKAFMGGEVTA